MSLTTLFKTTMIIMNLNSSNGVGFGDRVIEGERESNRFDAVRGVRTGDRAARGFGVFLPVSAI